MPLKILKHLKQWSGDVATPEPLFARKAASRWLVLHCPEPQRHVTFWVILWASSLVIFMLQGAFMVGSKSYFCSKWELRFGYFLDQHSSFKMKFWDFLGRQFPPKNSTGFAADRFRINFSWWRGWLLSCCLSILLYLVRWWRSPLWINLWCLSLEFQFQCDIWILNRLQLSILRVPGRQHKHLDCSIDGLWIGILLNHLHQDLSFCYTMVNQYSNGTWTLLKM